MNNLQLQQGNGFGMVSAQTIEDINKALSINYDQPPTSGASALRAYSIDGTLKSVTYNQKHIKLWNRFYKAKATSTVEEYVKLQNYGNMRAGAFVAAGALPQSQDSNYTRENKNVKYVGTTRAVQHQATVVETVVVDDLVAQEQVNGTIFLLGVIERSLFTGDSACVPEEWDGLIPELTRESATAPEIVIDCKGQDINKDTLALASTVILNNYGIPSLAYEDLDTMRKIQALFYENQRIVNNADGGVVGAVATDRFAYMPNQTFTYEPDVFLRPNEEPLNVAAGEVIAAPSVSTAAAAGGALPAGTYFYRVSAINAKGESAGSVEATQAATANQKITLTITPVAGVKVTGYRIFRSTVAGAEKEIAKIAAAANNAPTTFVDANENIEGTGKMLLLTDDPTNMAFKQLCPFIKIPLAIVDASIRWMQLLYGTPIVFTPRKNVLIKNINLK